MLTNAEVRIVQRVLQGRTRRVSMGPAWRRLHMEEGIGIAVGGALQLGERDLERLREMYDRATGGSSIIADWGADRVTVAEKAADEKLSLARAFGRLQRVASPSGIVIRSEGKHVEVPCPAGLLLSVETDRLVLEWPRVRRVVVVENGAIMEQWWDLVRLFPSGYLDGALLVYRGHDRAAAELLSILSQMPQQIALAVFPDLDPAGLVIASSFASSPRHSHGHGVDIVVPEDPLELFKFNKDAAHDRQRGHSGILLDNIDLGDEFRDLARLVEKKRLAISQETMLAQRAKLAVVPIRQISAL